MSYSSEAAARLRSDRFDRWFEQVASTGYCANPVRLVGRSETFDAITGQAVHTYESASEPDGVTYVRCGNRRATRCPSCSHEYKSDMWHLIVAGAAGGSKGVPTDVGTHPLVFVTLTAPSFGFVHSRPTSANERRVCRPRDKRELCPHGRPTWCMKRHNPDDELAGEPFCAECYDYAGQIVWQWYAPELWRRYVIRLRREIARELAMTESQAQELVRVQFAKVAEFQHRGVIHFHALIRLDGKAAPDDRYPEPVAPISGPTLRRMALQAARHTSVTAEPLPGETLVRRLTWGSQCDVRIVHGGAVDGMELSERAVAAYIAKYATKATEDVVEPGERTTSRPHVRRIRRAIGEIARGAILEDESVYRRLGRWDSMLGFRGHFSTKSRNYSTTLGRLRRARRAWSRLTAAQRAEAVVVGEQLDDEETTLVVGSWTFVGMGWQTSGDAALARQAAAAAREWRDAQAQRHKTRKD